MTITAFIPARSGSKRLPGKNIKVLAGKPLILWSLEACVRAPSVERVIFSTDSEAYWELARRHLGEEKLTLDWRAPDEAGDTVKIFDYLKNARSKIFRDTTGSFLMGLPTVPFRNTRHVEEAIALHRAQHKPVFSATEYGFAVSFAFYTEPDGSWTPLNAASPMITGNTRSQDQRTAYHPNGAIYVRAIEDLGKPELKTLYEGAVPYLMDRKYSVDIDNEADFIVADAMVRAGLLT